MTKEMEKNALNQDELEQASGGYIVDRGFWRDYWVVKDQVISEGTYNEWLKQKAQGNGPFSEYDKLKKRVLGY